MIDTENLYYDCCNRISQDYKAAEHILVGCIHYLLKKNGEKVSRTLISDHLASYNFEPYARQLKHTATMQQSSLHSLIASSIDLAPLLRTLKIIAEHINLADYEEVEGTTHCNKAKQISEVALIIYSGMKPLKHITTDSSKGG